MLMQKKQLMTVVSTLIVSLGLGAFQSFASRPLAEGYEERHPLPVSFYLGQLALKYDCPLIYEEAWEDGEPRNQIEAYLIPVISDNKDLQQELEYVGRNVTF